ncbi:FxSxx-COOH cyclophane-containing RiPP peptide [Streptomyces polygonati]|uniref:FxSxx-COOH cyclophane-containing RiPP peptide n=1 Tax=Streptomyces polygonati TaxID=1617087 RepID=A0ABV8HKE0_9ACTN
MESQRAARHPEEPAEPAAEAVPGGQVPHGTDGEAPDRAAPESAAGPEVDLLGMDLEALRTAAHPVLSELVAELRERVAGSGDESLWGHDSSV